MCTHKHTPAHDTAPVWRLEDNSQELVLSFHCMGSGDRTQVIRLGSKRLYPLSQFTGPRQNFSVVKYSKYLLSKTNVKWFEIKFQHGLNVSC